MFFSRNEYIADAVCVWRGADHPGVHRPHASPSPALPVGPESHDGVGYICSTGVPRRRFGAHGRVGECHRGGVCGGTELTILIDLLRRLSSFGFGFRVLCFEFRVYDVREMFERCGLDETPKIDSDKF